MTFTNRLNQFLIEAGRKHRYMEMFKPLLPKEGSTEKPERKKNVESRIYWATNNLKREDRVMWYLRKFRAYMKARDAGAGPHDDEVPGITDWNEINDLEDDFQHYISNAEVNNLTSVLKYIFPPDESAQTILRDLKTLEEKDLEKSTDRALDPDPDQKPIIKFADGWTWYLINAESCEKEGKAMKHCGNTGDPKEGDQLLSLREPVKTKKGMKLKPHLTFILNSGILGEMKGFANRKPDPKLHKYIVPLLESKYIKHLEGGGHAEENNFDLADLDETTKKQLLEKKPELDDLWELHKKDPDAKPIIESKVEDFYNYIFDGGSGKLDWDQQKLLVTYKAPEAHSKTPVAQILSSARELFHDSRGILSSYLHVLGKPAISTGVLDARMVDAIDFLKDHPLEAEVATVLGMQDFEEVIKTLQKGEHEDNKLEYVHSILRDGVKAAIPEGTIKSIEKQVLDYLQSLFHVVVKPKEWVIEIPFQKALKYTKQRIGAKVIDAKAKVDKEVFLKTVEPEFKKFLQKVKRSGG